LNTVISSAVNASVHRFLHSAMYKQQEKKCKFKITGRTQFVIGNHNS